MRSVQEKGQDSEVRREAPREAQGSHGQDCHGIAEQPPLARYSSLHRVQEKETCARHGNVLAVLSFGLTAAQPSQGRSSSKRKVKDTLESTAKKSESKPDDTDADLDVTVQMCVYSAEIPAAKAVEVAKVHTIVKYYIPGLLWSTNPTSDLQEALGMLEPTKGSRVLSILVTRKLQPITELHGEGFFDVWRQCLLCHVTLWKEGVYHRDVSPGNMKWYCKDGKRIGVLNDYDLSSLADVLGPRGNERTGTVPFMAIDLLIEQGQRGEVKHLYRHDLESFIWVFIWICLRYRKGVLLPTGTRPLDQWATLNAVTCGAKKRTFLSSLHAYYPWGIDQDMGCFLVECVDALGDDHWRRVNRLNKLLLQQIARRGATAQSNDDEPEDIDGFLEMFTTMPSWLKLTKRSNPSQ